MYVCVFGCVSVCLCLCVSVSVCVKVCAVCNTLPVFDESSGEIDHRKIDLM